jgi:L,D-transpeptidase ErfK/SrfK
LGDRWIGVSDLALGIHATNQPSSIYRFTTHGCIRLHPADARSLFDVVWLGMPIRIVYQPVLLALTDPDHVMVEVHADVYRRAAAPVLEIVRRLRELNADIVDLKTLNEILRRKAGRGISLKRRIRPDPTSTW